MLLRNSLKYLFRSCAALVLVVLSVFAVAGQAFAINGVHTFANPGTAIGGFKPVGNHFLVSEKFEPDSPPNDTTIWYNNVGVAPESTVTGMIIKADGINLISFNLTDMKFIIYDLAGSAEDITSLKITGTKVGGGTVSVTLNPPSTAAGASFTLTGLSPAPDLSGFTDITQLSFDITTNNAVYNIDFATITTSNEVYEVITTPTIQTSALQAYKTGDTEVALNWTKGNGNSRMVFAKQGVTSGVPTLADSTTYTPNASFSSATDIGGGWKCVYGGNADYAMISGLSASTQYRFVVFEYNGYSGGEKYLQTTPATLNQSTLGSFGVWTGGDILTLNAENFWTWTDADRDSSGNTYVAHRYNQAGLMEVEKWNGTAWSTLTSFTPATAGYGSFGDGSSMAVTGTDQFRLAIYGVTGASTSWGIVEAKYNGTAWSYRNLETSSTVNQLFSTPLISVDGNGNSHILYEFYNAAASPQVQYIKLASWSGASWSYQTLSTISNPNSYNEVKKTYLLLNDASNKQHIFYLRQTSTAATDLHYWTNSSGSWVDTAIFTGNTDAPYKLSGAFDSSGKLHLTYTNNTLLGKVVMYLTNKSGSWVTQPLMTAGTGWDTGYTAMELRINGSGDIVIPLRLKASTTTTTNNSFKVLLKQGSNPWYVSTLSPLAPDYEDDGNSYPVTGTTFRDDGKVMIAYANALASRPRKLMYAMAALSQNTSPTFVGATTTLTVNRNASATDITNLLHVSDSDPSQTETWTVTGAPGHGTLGGFPATASSGLTDITPGSTITYTPTSGYSGPDSFTVQVSDGTATATRTITVTVMPPPTVTTQAASAITATIATGNGNITATGGANATARGLIYWGYNNSDQIIGDGGVTDVSEVASFGTGAFTAALTPLVVNSQYNARAYATSPSGTGYGARVAFWTLANVPSAPTVNNAAATTLDVTVNVNGNPANTEFAIQETSTGNYVQAGGTLGGSAVWQTTAVWGTKTVTGLTTGSTYTFQVKARNGASTETAFGATASGLPVAAPTVTTQAASTIAATSATGNGNITATNGANATTRGVIYYAYTNTDKVIGDGGVTDVSEAASFGTGAFTAALTPLAVNIQYNARAYAINPYGTGYGARVAFWTLANVPSAPTVNNATATTLDVTVNVNGNPASTEFAIQETGGNYLQAGGTLGVSAVWQTAAVWGTKTVTGLTTGSSYTFQVKARNGGSTETAYGATTSLSVGVGVASPTISEDTDSGAIAISGGTPWYKITGITGGTLYRDAIYTFPFQIADGNFIATAGATTNVYFRPTANFNGAAGFSVQGSTTTADGGLTANIATSTITVTPIADTPGVASPTVNEDTDSGAIAITRNAADGAETSHYKITSITGGTLYSNASFTTLITNGDFIASTGATTNVYFRPAANRNSTTGGNGSFIVQASKSNLDAGLGGSTATSTITLTPVADTPSVASPTINEDTDSGAIAITRNAADGAETSHYKITGITGGMLYSDAGYTTQITTGSFIASGGATTNVYFRPAANRNTTTGGNGSFIVQASSSNADAGLGSSTATSTITLTPIADTPSITPASTTPATQTSSGLVVSRNVADGAEVTYFKITNIVNGTLYQNNCTTAISAGSFITYAQANAGLKFTPSGGSDGSFDLQASISNADAGLGGSVVTATITVGVGVASPTINEDTDSSGIAISGNTAFYKITGITGGTLYSNAGFTTTVANGSFIPTAGATTNVYFRPTANFNGAAGFSVQGSTTSADGGLVANVATSTITVTPVADTPSITPATTTPATQSSSGLVVSRNVADGPEVTHFKITNVANGTLYLNDGATAVVNNDFISYTAAHTGLKFTPSGASNGSFHLQASTSNLDAGLGGSVVTATITVATPPGITSATSTAFTINTPGSFTVTTIGTPAPSIGISGALPTGITFVDNGNGSATLSGTPSLGTSGGHPLTITAHNIIGPDASQSFILTIDKKAAPVSLSGLNQIYDGSPKAVSASTVPAGLSVDITYSGIAPTVYPESSTAPTTAGSYTAVATINDTNYQGSRTDILVITDTTNPSLTVITLPDGSYTNISSLNVNGTALDAGSGIKNLTINGTDIVGTPAYNAVSGDFSTMVVLTPGPNTITVIATDNATNSTTNSRGVTLDQAAPDLTINSPADNSSTKAANIDITGTISDSSTVTVTATVGSSTPKPALIDGSNYNVNVDLTAGWNSITITATDLALNSNSVTRSILSDGTNPELTITGPAADFISTDGNVTITGSVTDISITTVSLTVDGKNYNPTVTDGSFSQPLTFTTEGLYPITVTATDQATNSTTVIRNILYSKGSIIINGGAPYTNSATVNLGLLYSPTPAQMQLFYNKTWNKPETYNSSKAITLPKGDGSKTVTVRYLDDQGNASLDYSATIILDTIRPVGGINIENGAKQTSKTTLALNLFASDINGIAFMQFSEDGINWSTPITYSSSHSYILNNSANGIKKIRVRYQDNSGKWSAIYSDSITITDGWVPPIASGGSITLASSDPSTPAGYVSGKHSTCDAWLQIMPWLPRDSCGQNIAGASVIVTINSIDLTTWQYMSFSSDSIKWSSWERSRSAKKLNLPSGDGIKTIYARFAQAQKPTPVQIDSTLYSASIILDSKAPVGSIRINNGAKITNNPTVELDLDASDINGITAMRINHGQTTVTDEPYIPTKTVTLLGADGSKSVTVIFIDNAGNRSKARTAHITLDTKVPASKVTASLIPGVTYPSQNVKLTLTSPQAVNMELSFDGGTTWQMREPYSTSKKVALPSGSHSIHARFTDLAGNVSNEATADIMVP